MELTKNRDHFPMRINSLTKQSHRPSDSERLNWHDFLWLCILGFLLIGITFHNPMQVNSFYIHCDPLGSLLTSQAILHQGTIKLDSYAEKLENYGNNILTKNNHSYYYFPLGTSLYALPFVMISNIIGRMMSEVLYEVWLQSVLSTLTVAVCLVLIFFISRCLMNCFYSVIFTTTFIFGSSIISTMGTALWSINFEVIFILTAILMIIYDSTGKYNLNPFLLGIILFSAYLCRPTAITFIMPVVVYLFFKNRFIFFKVCMMYSLLLGAFIYFSFSEYKQILPPYYLPQRIGQTQNFGIALYGNLFSPARGIFIYHSYLLLPLFGGGDVLKKVVHSPFIWISMIWFAMHMITISTFSHWWGGWSFGSRLQTETIPAFLLFTIIVWDEIIKNVKANWAKMVSIIFVGLAIISIFIHSYQGLYNMNTAKWNMLPNIDIYPQFLFDWKFPQFLSTHESLEAKLLTLPATPPPCKDE